MAWEILCDFDGTISLEDVIDCLLEAYGHPGWETLEQDWQAGLIGSRECMAGQVALLNMDQATLDQRLDQIPLDPGFVGFTKLAASLHLSLRIVSDGLDYAIARILNRHQIAAIPVAANHLSQEHGQWRMDSPFQAPGCASGTCKCAQVTAARHAGAQQVLLIGDGTSDFCGAYKADFVFAKGRLAEHCQRAHIPHIAIRDFAEAALMLPLLVSGRLQAAPTRTKHYEGTDCG